MNEHTPARIGKIDRLAGQLCDAIGVGVAAQLLPPLEFITRKQSFKKCAFGTMPFLVPLLEGESKNAHAAACQAIARSDTLPSAPADVVEAAVLAVSLARPAADRFWRQYYFSGEGNVAAVGERVGAETQRRVYKTAERVRKGMTS